MMKAVNQWSPEDVGEWLKSSGFEDYIALFRNEHKIDGSCLLTLNEEDLRSPPLQLKVLGDIKRLLLAIKRLQQENLHLLPHYDSGTSDLISLNHTLQTPTNNSNNLQNNSHNKSRQDNSNRSSFANDFLNDINDDSDFFAAPQENALSNDELQPEAWKAVVAMLYFFSVTWITAFVMVIVHDRVPDMQTYPPLPDIFLDNVPLIPWAFSMCEVCGLILFTIWCIILIFHRHR